MLAVLGDGDGEAVEAAGAGQQRDQAPGEAVRQGAELEDERGEEHRRREQEQRERGELAGADPVGVDGRRRRRVEGLVDLPGEAGDQEEDHHEPADELPVVPRHRGQAAVPGARAPPGAREDDEPDHEEHRQEHPGPRREPREPGERRPGLLEKLEGGLAVLRHELDDAAVLEDVDAERREVLDAEPVLHGRVRRDGRRRCPSDFTSGQVAETSRLDAAGQVNVTVAPAGAVCVPPHVLTLDL